MIFYIHFILLTSGLSGTSVLLGVFMKYYSDASQGEIGVLLMTFPFMSIIIKPLFCSLADRYQAHRAYLIAALLVLMIGFAPFIIIPYFPDFYTQTPRLSWYLLVISCYIGNGGLAVAWSLGESLAMNSSQKTNTPYGRLRLFGTVSWGVYGYIIGQINEVPFVPKFVPAFMILLLSVFIEIIMLLLWNKEAFIMVDTSLQDDTQDSKMNQFEMIKQQSEQQQQQQSRPARLDLDSGASSLCGTLRIRPKAAKAIMDLVLLDDFTKRLKALDHDSNGDNDNNNNNNNNNQEKQTLEANIDSIKKGDFHTSLDDHLSAQLTNDNTNNNNNKVVCELGDAGKSSSNNEKRNPQIIIFRMIMAEDGRLIKYLILFTMVGLLLAPLNFVFLSLDDVCKEGKCNFSELAGSVLISQAASETFCFLLVPWLLVRIRRSVAILFALTILTARYFFYAGFYYTANISPYWALIGEWGHGIGYAICATILADVALMFANQCKLFIPEMRRLGFLSEHDAVNQQSGKVDGARVLAEENSIKMALRATMQAIFGAVMDGLGSGVGSLVCGVVVETYSYIKLWQLFTILVVGTAIIHQLVEVTKCKWSDSFKPRVGSKGFEIRSTESGKSDGKSKGANKRSAEMGVEKGANKEPNGQKAIAVACDCNNNNNTTTCELANKC